MSSKGFSLRSLQKRILVVFLLISLVFFALFFRLFLIQVVDAKSLQQKAEDQWTRALPLYAQRGEIVDCNQTVLANSEVAYNIYSRAREIKNPSAVATDLSKILGIKFSIVFDKINNAMSSEILLAKNQSFEVALKVHKCNFDGIYVAESATRNYSFGNLLTQVLGFTTSDGVGQSGIELYYNKNLTGKNGYVLVQSDLTGKAIDNSLETYLPSTQGNKIELTIDANLQRFVENALEQIMVEQKAKSASAILLNAENGEILAMGQKPSFDLNNVPRDNVSALMEMVKNHMVVDVYEPGSTFKIITMAIALQTGVAHLSDRFYCNGSCVVDGEKIKCWKSTGHGSQTLAEGLANSCNCVFTALAQRIGLDKFYEYLSLFGYGQKTGIEIGGESSGLLMNKSLVKVVDLARMGFGQAVAVTQLQQVVGVACAVNGGNLLMPYLVKKIYDENNNVIFENKPQTKRQVISKDVSKTLCDMLELTVSKQTGHFSFVKGYNLGGKTGTTQKYADGKIAGTYISSFVGVYPIDNPKFVLLIAVDEPSAGAYYGSIVASPYAKTIFSDLFEYYSILPDDPEVLKQETKSFEMPNLVGMSLTKAIQTISAMNLAFEIDGDGGMVKTQLPSATTKVFATDTILIST